MEWNLEIIKRQDFARRSIGEPSKASTRYEMRIFEMVARIKTKGDLLKNSCHVSTEETMGDL